MKVPWGSWNVETGQWFPNPHLEMSPEEQLRQNELNGFFKKGDWTVLPSKGVILNDKWTCRVRVE